jgi:hypothetical protein
MVGRVRGQPSRAERAAARLGRGAGHIPEVFGDGVRAALDAAPPPDEHGWRAVTLSFEHARAAAHRLAGFGGQVEVLSPGPMRNRLLAVAQEIIDCYRTGTSPGPGNENGRR